MSATDNIIEELLELSGVHEEWLDILRVALQQVNKEYLQNLYLKNNWLPGKHRLFAAFKRNRKDCKYILFGESPYPRAESANGIAFYDAAVDELWSDKGLSKSVNRATSLRNIIKTALVAEGHITPHPDGKIPQSLIAELDKSQLISSITELFETLHQRGFLMFNATPVLSEDIKPVKEAKFWHGFINILLQEIKQNQHDLPVLVLWGKIAQQMEMIEAAHDYQKITCEHPYNLSFIHNPVMLSFFSELKILQK